MKYIDLNCDMGESFGQYTFGNDGAIIKLISSANIACGFHAGDPNVMDETVKLAKLANVGIGAHVGFADLLGFGRRPIDMSADELINDIIYQIGALQAFCTKHDTELQHVKPHGAMANLAYVDENVAEAVTDAIQTLLPKTKLFVIENSVLHHAAVRKGIPFVREVFADRRYTDEGTLVSRQEKGAVIEDEETAAKQVLQLALTGTVTSINGQTLSMHADSICVHSDTNGALELVRKIRHELVINGIKIAPVSQWLKQEGE